jgi:4,5-DOPA dioxygenase extradiol
LRNQGVLIVGSGNVVHNLRRIDFAHPERSFDWAERFDAEVKRIMTSNPAGLPALTTHRDYALSVPTPEHFLPLLYIAGLCHEARQPAAAFTEGCTMGSLSMTSYVLGGPTVRYGTTGHDQAAPLPDPRAVPPEDTNT